MTHALLDLRDVCVRFPGSGTNVLQDINLTIDDGEFVTVVGPSGSGKTTLLRVIHGLLPAAAGTVIASGREVRRPTRERGFVFQSDSLLPWRSVQDNVGYPLELQGVRRAAARRRAAPLLAMTGLADAAEKYPAQLSGGMRQRVNVARALASDPEILMMDEPFAALDAQTREVLQAELLSIWQQRRKTVVFVTHQLDEAVYLADKVVVLSANPGQVREIVPVHLPRPRSLDVKHTLEFTQIVDSIWQLIKDEVLLGQRVHDA
ncbi:ABC transporter ATP-binding protein [Jiangella muralis]|uniref:ABC transporter ATP-binding protein n=1 Tax=Jiangella muralis TaxID=702383 RepID=UPI00069CD13C|nr:ABC transporter ATP-binding protein [Jiangella muralis]